MIDLETAIRIDPGNANNYILQAIVFEKMGQKEEAQRCRDKAVTLGADRDLIIGF